MASLAQGAQFLAGLLVPVSLEMVVRKTRNGLYLGCLAVLAFVVGKEFIYDVLVEKQSILHDPGDSSFYLVGAAAAVIVVLAHHKRKSKKAKK